MMLIVATVQFLMISFLIVNSILAGKYQIFFTDNEIKLTPPSTTFSSNDVQAQNILSIDVEFSLYG